MVFGTWWCLSGKGLLDLLNTFNDDQINVLLFLACSVFWLFTVSFTEEREDVTILSEINVFNQIASWK